MGAKRFIGQEGGKFSERSFLILVEVTMKPYSISGIAAHLAALLTLMMLTIGLNMPAQAQTNAAERGASASSQQEGAIDGRPCGGPMGLTCREGLICVDNPGDNCDPRREGSKCPGTCKVNLVKEDDIQRPCGGTTGYNCPGGMVCVDDPSDDCNPTQDGSKCKGICVRSAQ